MFTKGTKGTKDHENFNRHYDVIRSLDSEAKGIRNYLKGFNFVFFRAFRGHLFHYLSSKIIHQGLILLHVLLKLRSICMKDAC